MEKINNILFGLTIILILFCGVINIGISKINKVYAAKYCKYSSSSKICQELAKNCTIDQPACMNKTKIKKEIHSIEIE